MPRTRPTPTRILFAILAGLLLLPVLATGQPGPVVRPLVDPPTGLEKAPRLSAKGLGAQTTPEACVTQTIACNSVRTGALTPDDCLDADGFFYDGWEFQTPVGTTVTIDLSSNAFDSYLLLWDPDFYLLAEDDDGGGGTDSRIVFTIDRDGPWTIDASSYFAEETGPYVLSLACSGSGSDTPVPPSGLTAEAVSADEIYLDWLDNSFDETEFRIEMRPPGGSFTDIGGVPADTTAAAVSQLDPATPYDFRVRARNASGSSNPSNVASATTLGGGGTGSCVEDLEGGVVCLRDGRFEISGIWTDFSNPPTALPIIWTPMEDFNALGGHQINPTGIQTVMRIADGCHLTDTWWIWLGGFSDTGWDITVRDTTTGAVRTFHRNPQAGSFPTTTRDTTTFVCQ